MSELQTPLGVAVDNYYLHYTKGFITTTTSYCIPVSPSQGSSVQLGRGCVYIHRMSNPKTHTRASHKHVPIGVT